jgi:hypothetical protein
MRAAFFHLLALAVFAVCAPLARGNGDTDTASPEAMANRPDQPKVRVFKLDKGGAAAIAELLDRALAQNGNRNPVKVIIPGRDPAQAKPPKHR